MKHDERWNGFAADYALGAADAEEAAAYEAHLETCAACRDEVREARETAALLAHAVTPATPPPSLRDRILAEARGVRPIATAPGGSERQRDARYTPPAWMPAALAASVALALVSLVLFAAQRGRNASLAGELAVARETADALDARAARLDSLVQARDSLIDAVLGVGVRTGTLVSEGRPPAARLFWNRDRGIVVIAVNDLPPAPAGRTYQLWGIAPGRAPVSLGTFDSEPDGSVAVTLPVPAGLEFSVGAVTEEPAGGSPQPTTTPFLVGPVGE